MATVPSTDDLRPFGLGLRAWLLVLVGVSLLRLLVAASAPVYETEAYYWLWSRHPAGGYFDHPPMIAWLCHLTDFFGPPHALAVRLHAVLSHFAASVLMYFLGRNLLGSARLGVLSALVYNVIPFHSAIAVQNQPDSPLLLFWIATVFCFERALSTERRWWWIAAGACAGGAFLSKFHGFVFVGFIFVYLLASRRDRRWARTPWPYLALLTALLVYSPNIVWNARHDWMTYRFQLLGQGREPEFKVGRPLLTLAAPFVNLSPWMFVATVALWWRIVRSGDWLGTRERALLFWLTAPIYAFFLAMSLRQQIKFHWTAPAFALVCPILAAEIGAWTPRRGTWFLASGAAVSAAVYAFMALAPFAHLVLPAGLLPPVAEVVVGKRGKTDWTLHGVGWSEIGAIIREEVAASDSTAPTFILARRFDRAAIAAFESEMPDRAWVLDPGPTYRQSYKEPDPRAFLGWQNPHAVEGSNAIYVFYERDGRYWKREMEMLARCFRETGPLQKREILVNGKVLRHFYFMRCTGFVPDALAVETPEMRGTAQARQPTLTPPAPRTDS